MAELPPLIQDVVFGQQFPKAVISAMRRAAGVWRAAGDECHSHKEKVDREIGTISTAVLGVAGPEIVAAAGQLSEALFKHGEYCYSMAEHFDRTALETEKSQWQMALFGAMLVQQLWIAAPAIWTGVGTVAEAAALTEARQTATAMFRALIAKLTEGGAAAAAKRLALVARNFALFQVGVDAGIQAGQIVAGHRTFTGSAGIDGKSLLISTLQGGGAAVFGRLGGDVAETVIPRATSTMLGRASVKFVEAVSGLAGAVGAAATVTHQFDLTLAAVLNGAAFGLAGAAAKPGGAGPTVAPPEPVPAHTSRRFALAARASGSVEFVAAQPETPVSAARQAADLQQKQALVTELNAKFPQLRARTHELLDPRIPVEMVRDVKRGVEDMLTRFPRVDLRHTGFLDLGPEHTGLSYRSRTGARIAVNSFFATRPEHFRHIERAGYLSGRTAAEVAADPRHVGLHPRGTGRLAYDTFVHEFGHSMNEVTAGTVGRNLESVLAEGHARARAEGRTTLEYDAWVRQLGKASFEADGTLNRREAVADAFADIQINGGKAGTPQRVIHDALVEAYHERVASGELVEPMPLDYAPDTLDSARTPDGRLPGRGDESVSDPRLTEMRVIAEERSALESLLTEVGWPADRIINASLPLSEIHTNAVGYAGGGRVDVEFSGTKPNRTMKVTVVDNAGGRPPERETGAVPDLDAEGGRGSFLVEMMTHANGIIDLPGGGKGVWFTLHESAALPGEPQWRAAQPPDEPVHQADRAEPVDRPAVSLIEPPPPERGLGDRVVIDVTDTVRVDRMIVEPRVDPIRDTLQKRWWGDGSGRARALWRLTVGIATRNEGVQVAGRLSTELPPGSRVLRVEVTYTGEAPLRDNRPPHAMEDIARVAIRDGATPHGDGRAFWFEINESGELSVEPRPEPEQLVDQATTDQPPVRIPDLLETSHTDLREWAAGLGDTEARRAMSQLQEQADTQLAALRRGEPPQADELIGTGRGLNALVWEQSRRFTDNPPEAPASIPDNAGILQVARDFAARLPEARALRDAADTVYAIVGTVTPEAASPSLMTPETPGSSTVTSQSRQLGALQFFPQDIGRLTHLLEHSTSLLPELENPTMPYRREVTRQWWDHSEPEAKPFPRHTALGLWERLPLVTHEARYLAEHGDTMWTVEHKNWAEEVDKALTAQRGTEVNSRLVSALRALPGGAARFERLGQFSPTATLGEVTGPYLSNLLIGADYYLTRTRDVTTALDLIGRADQVLAEVASHTHPWQTAQDASNAVNRLFTHLTELGERHPIANPPLLMRKYYVDTFARDPRTADLLEQTLEALRRMGDRRR